MSTKPRPGTSPGESLRAFRHTLGMRQTDLAAEVGVTVRTVKRWESGESRIPTTVFLYLEHRTTTTGEKKMFYVIENSFVGRNNDPHGDASRIEISTIPACENGVSGDWSVRSHGEYVTLEDARTAIKEVFEDVRSTDPDGNEFESDDEAIVEIYKPGKFSPFSSQEAADWTNDDVHADITAATTDEQIAALLVDYEAEANRHGYTLGDEASNVKGFMESLREDLRAELEG